MIKYTVEKLFKYEYDAGCCGEIRIYFEDEILRGILAVSREVLSEGGRYYINKRVREENWYKVRERLGDALGELKGVIVGALREKLRVEDIIRAKPEDERFIIEI